MARATPNPDRVTRVVTLPIREVIADHAEPGIAGVLATFRPLWAMSTRLANWAQRELALRDVRRTAGMTTLPKYDRRQMFGTVPRTANRKPKSRVMADGSEKVTPGGQVGDPQEGSLYRLFTDAYPDRVEWDGCAVSARDVLTAVEKAWVGQPRFGRFAVQWLCQARPAVFRFPYPWPVPADKGKTLRIMRVEPDRPHASIPAPGQAENRILLRLADGREYRRQLRQFDWLLGNLERLRQAKITGWRKNGRLVGADLRIVAAFDRAERGPGDATAIIRTGPGALLTATVEGGEIYVYHGDELPGVVALYDDWRERFATDMKHEKRWPADVRTRRFNGPRVQAKREAARDRLRTAKQTAAAQIVAWMVRQGVAKVEYDDTDKTFLPRFDWTGLRAVVSFKCQEAGIEFQHIAGVDDADE